MALHHVNRNSLLARALYACGGTLAQMAKEMDVSVHELSQLIHLRRGQLVETDMDDMWTRLAAHVDKRIGELMSVREEIHRKQQSDIKARLERLTRMRQR